MIVFDRVILFVSLCATLLYRHIFKARGSDDTQNPDLTAVAFHKPTHILVSGFANGTFMIHEMPEFNPIHSLT